jgi:hypothetical protein
MENLKPVQLGGCDGPGLCSIYTHRTESTKLPYMRVLVRVEMSLLCQSFAARCTAAPAAVSRQLISLSRLQSALM